MVENPSNQVSDTIGSEALKDITNVIKKSTVGSGEITVTESDAQVINSTVSSEDVERENAGSVSGSMFKVASTNLPEKTGFWTKVKNALFYEIKIELTPYQQKIEREINEFLHQEITWKSLKEAALSEVPITFRGKRIF